MKHRDSKVCIVCGREMQWRKRWENNWASVRYCSRACRRRKLGPDDRRLEDSIRALLQSRGTLRPDEVALYLNESDAGRAYLISVFNAARRLAHNGHVEFINKGRVIDPSDANRQTSLRLARTS